MDVERVNERVVHDHAGVERRGRVLKDRDERDHPHHNSRFDVNESVLWTGAAAMAAFALRWQD